jgi:hypothetical protein
MNFEEWWSNGQIVAKEIIVGLLSDDNKFHDDIIIDEDGFFRFRKAIAIHVTKGNMLVNNTEDYFLNGKVIDFEKECLIVVKAAVVEKVLYSDLFQCYVVYLGTEAVDPEAYCAIICRKVYGLHGIYKFSIMGNKPKPVYMRRLKVMNEEY